jgi:hypothetical protein
MEKMENRPLSLDYLKPYAKYHSKYTKLIDDMVSQGPLTMRLLNNPYETYRLNYLREMIRRTNNANSLYAFEINQRIYICRL